MNDYCINCDQFGPPGSPISCQVFEAASKHCTGKLSPDTFSCFWIDPVSREEQKQAQMLRLIGKMAGHIDRLIRAVHENDDDYQECCQLLEVAGCMVQHKEFEEDK